MDFDQLDIDADQSIDTLGDDSQQSTQLGDDGQTTGQCYCAGERDLREPDFLCFRCRKWFHRKCSHAPHLLPALPFQTAYTFLCRQCSPQQQESFSRRQTNFQQMCETALANLTLAASSGQPSGFSAKQVINFLEHNWHHMTSMPRRVKSTWHVTVAKTMAKESETFVQQETQDTEPLFQLRQQNLFHLQPNYHLLGDNAARERPQKKRKNDVQEVLQRRQKSELTIPRLPTSGFPQEFPFNKDGYRYVLAEADPHGPCRQEFEESQDLAGKPIPGWLCRRLAFDRVGLSLHDRAPQLKISEDRKSVSGDKGYCMVRANFGAASGHYFFECTVDELPDGAAVRLGWAQELANLQAPLGFDKFGFSIRSRKGTVFHDSRGRHFDDTLQGFGKGDTMGFLISLPTTRPPLPPTYKDRPLVKFKSFLYFEQKDDTTTATRQLKQLHDSRMVIFKNGRRMGVAFKDLYEGLYYPSASLYKNATVSFNFGPDFRFGADEPCLPVSSLVTEEQVKQTVADILYLVENEGRLRLDAFYGN